jgi:hypothetical protein
MIAADTDTRLSARAIDRLQHLRGFINNGGSFIRIWNDFLTEPERAQLGGNIVQAINRRSPVRCWMFLRGVNDAQAIYELADFLGLVHDGDRRWLAPEIEQLPNADLSHHAPRWVPEVGELRLGNRVIRKVRLARIPTGAQRILDAFERLGWPTQAPSPFSDTREPGATRSYVKQLNKNLQSIRFGVQGAGSFVTWRFAQTETLTNSP